MRPEAVTNQHPWLLVSLFSSLGIKHALEPLQANLGVGVPRFGACIVPSRGRERGPVASMGIRWPDYHRVQIPTIATDAFDRSHGCALDSRTSIISLVILTSKDFHRAWQVENWKKK